ncbi:hypothetical protein [Halobacterium zhouii]|uniref:hypothetical protein n=1 Tax=Halobacterium zhouii TaxID=2902624 RepID=UPI001E4167E1|nr:hypothetical protein [Halobacterium zhouii]
MELRDRIVLHGETAPYHRRLQREQGIDYADIHTWTDLRTTFDCLDDDALRNLDPTELVPEHYSADDLVRSRSSGTTGPVKDIYWHEADVAANLDSVEARLRALPVEIPTGTHWVATATRNPVLARKLTKLAERFDSTIDLIEVDPAPVKRALRSRDEETIKTALDPIADRIQSAFETNDARVYEDIAPMMQYVGTRLPEKHRDRIALALIGGVGTDHATLEHITNEAFTNAVLTGWYGDYMTGSSMMHTPGSLEYIPHTPDVRLEVRSPNGLDKVVEVGEVGEVVAHAIRRGFFVPNRRIGDQATRIKVDGTDGITDVGRRQEELQ